MLKSVQIKIIIIFTIITIILVTGISVYYIVNFQQIGIIAQNEHSSILVDLSKKCKKNCCW